MNSKEQLIEVPPNNALHESLNVRFWPKPAVHLVINSTAGNDLLRTLLLQDLLR